VVDQPLLKKAKANELEYFPCPTYDLVVALVRRDSGDSSSGGNDSTESSKDFNIVIQDPINHYSSPQVLLIDS
jgi:hypothetical protein